MTRSFPETIRRRADSQTAPADGRVRLFVLSARAWALLGTVTVALLAVLASCASDPEVTADVEIAATATPQPIAEEVVQQRTSIVALGAVAAARSGETPAEALERLEAIAGRRLDYVRFEIPWDGEFPSQEHLAAAAEGRALHVVVSAQRRDGSAVAWSDMASVRFGEPLFAEIQSWIARLAEFDGELFVTFDRLPDTAVDRGDAADFVAAWRRLHTDLSARAPEIETIWTISQDALLMGTAAQWYPGEDVVDRIGADLRNSFGCAGGDAQWRSPQETLSPLIAFGAQHPGKPLVVAEIATHEDAAEPLRKSAWFGELVDLLSTAAFEQVMMAGFFDGERADQPECDWRIDSSSVSGEAFGALALATTFGGDDAEPAVVSCPARLRVPADLSDEALVDTDGDGIGDVAFGGQSPAVGVGDQGADGHDQRVVVRFPALPTVLAEGEWVELRVRLASPAPQLESPLVLEAIPDIAAFGLTAFDSDARTITSEFIAPGSPGGYYAAAVTDALAPGLPSVFRLRLAQAPLADDRTDAYLVAMAEAVDEADRPTLLVRSC